MAKYPKAIQKPITRHDTLRTRDRGICHHVAASESSSLFGYFNQKGNPTSHFYVRKDGTVEQYVDTKFQAPAQLEGNHDMISIETAGGLSDRTADREPWSEAQVAALTELDAWICKTHKGIPLQMMRDSKPTSKGFGYHKLGIDPYRVAGGEKWSGSAGKICPGLEKIDQIKTKILPGVVNLLGQNTTEDELSAAEVTDLKNFIESRTQAYAAFDAKHVDQVLAQTELDVKKMIADAAEGVRAYTEAATVSIKDYVRQTDNEQDILSAVATLAMDLRDLKAQVDKLPKA